MSTREKAMVESLDLPSTATEKQTGQIIKLKHHFVVDQGNILKVMTKQFTFFEDATHCE